jgi:hypothetical protein
MTKYLILIALALASTAPTAAVVCVDLGGGVIKCRETGDPSPRPVTCVDLGGGVIKCN